METHGRPPRRRGWDYGRAGVYFVTLVVKEWRPWFRVGADPYGPLTSAGALVEQIWSRLPSRFPRVALDLLVIMPEHIHGVIVLRQTSGPRTPLGEVVRYWKGAGRTSIKADHPAFHWKTGYYDRIVRSPRSLALVRRYIRQNPENYRGPWNTLPAEPRDT
jgi:REP element-mobilizing transposase RayT